MNKVQANEAKHQEPYYASDKLVLYHGDCRELLPALGQRWADVVLTDPPFFIPPHFQSTTNWQRTWGDTSIMRAWWSMVCDATVPILKPGGHMLTFCNHDSYPVFYPEIYGRFDDSRCLVWDKQRIGLGHGWRNQHELVIAARWRESRFYKSRSNVLPYSVTPAKKRVHPIHKPEVLMREMIEVTCPVGGTVVDLFAGSGTTLLAAIRAGRRAVGFEIEKRYCEAIVRMVDG